MLVVREGHGANCSSVGSTIDTLFMSAVAGGAIFAAILAALKQERAEEPERAPPKQEEESEP